MKPSKVSLKMNNLKSVSLVLLKEFCLVLFCVFLGLTFLIIAFLLPTNSISAHSNQAVDIFTREGLYPNIIGWGYGDSLDNFTDAIMLSIASYEGDESSLEKSLLDYYWGNDTDDTVSAYIDYARDNTSALKKITYGRYWHGYVAILRPMLCLTGYRDIRIINSLFQIFLAIYLLNEVYQHYRGLFYPLLISWTMLVPFITPFSLQYSSSYSLCIIFCILVCRQHIFKSLIYMFTFFGCCTAYFDLLTYPMVTLCFPLILYIYLSEDSFCFRSLRRVVVLCLSWSFGYLSFWGLKWAIASIVTDVNIVGDALKTIKERTSSVSGNGKRLSLMYVYFKNIRSFIFVPTNAILLFCHAVSSFVKFQKGTLKPNQKALLYCFIAFIPPLWFAVTMNHASIHCWMTNKQLAATCFAVFLVFSPEFKDPAGYRPEKNR